MDGFAIVLIFFVALLAGAYPFYQRIYQRGSANLSSFQSGEALASGVFLGAGLLHMLSDSALRFNQLGYQYPLPFLLAGLTFLILLLLEHTGREVYEHRGESSPGFAILAFVMLSLHSFLAGAALGLSASLSVFIVILMAILAHKWAAGFALAVQITKSLLPLRSGLVLFLVFSVMTPAGIFAGHLVHSNLTSPSLVEPIFTALAAGTFLYLGTLHGLSRSIMVNKCCDLMNYLFVILGFSIMAVVAVWA
jgi:zinc transporter ZupT